MLSPIISIDTILYKCYRKKKVTLKRDSNEERIGKNTRNTKSYSPPPFKIWFIHCYDKYNKNAETIDNQNREYNKENVKMTFKNDI